ncbi:nucleoside monophosphate kinase [Candidatus Saccharibacteria bacterium]|nr:nucleoside monophosphate kinase [Candidatus Saccharibacteria bacterium]
MIVILGMAGAGKSTQCKLLSKDGYFQWLPVGQILRDLESGADKLEMMMGKVLDDKKVTPVVRDKIAELGDSPELILDGCPRTENQAIWLAEHTETPLVRLVIHLKIEDDVAIERLLKRGREDDSEDAIKVRMSGYHRDIGSVLSIFNDYGIKIVEIDASQSVDDVQSEIRRIIS